MNDPDGKKLALALGFMDDESLDQVLQTHPTVQAYMAGAVTFTEAMFIEEYLSNGFNHAAAMRSVEARALQLQAYERVGRFLMKKAVVRRLLARRLAEQALAADEVLAQLASVATASMEDFVDVRPVTDPVTEQEMWIAVPDIRKARDSGKLHLAKELTYDKEGTVKIKLRDADKALDMLAKHLGLFELDNLQKVPTEIAELLKLSAAEKKERLSEYRNMMEWSQPSEGNLPPSTDEAAPEE